MFAPHHHQAFGDLGRLIFRWLFPPAVADEQPPADKHPPEHIPAEYWHETPKLYSKMRGRY